MARKTSTQRRALQGLGNGALVLMLLWTAIPFYWMIVTSLKYDKEIYGYEATLIPQRPTLANYATVFRETPYLLYLRNSVAVAVGSTIEARDLPEALLVPAQAEAAEAPATERPTLEETVRGYVLRIRAESGGNKTAAARALDVPRRTLYRMLERYAGETRRGKSRR